MFHLLRNVDPVTLKSFTDNPFLLDSCLLHMSVKALYDALEVMNSWGHDPEYWHNLAVVYYEQMKGTFFKDYGNLFAETGFVSTAYTYIVFKYRCCFFRNPAFLLFEDVGFKIINNSKLTMDAHSKWRNGPTVFRSCLFSESDKYDRSLMYACYLWEDVRRIHERECIQRGVRPPSYPNVFHWEMSKHAVSRADQINYDKDRHKARPTHADLQRNIVAHAILMFCDVMCKRGELVFLKCSQDESLDTYYPYLITDNIVFEDVYSYFHYTKFSHSDPSSTYRSAENFHADQGCLNSKAVVNSVISATVEPGSRVWKGFSDYVRNKVFKKTSDSAINSSWKFDFNVLFVRLEDKLMRKSFVTPNDIPLFLSDCSEIAALLESRSKWADGFNSGNPPVLVNILSPFLRPYRKSRGPYPVCTAADLTFKLFRTFSLKNDGNGEDGFAFLECPLPPGYSFESRENEEDYFWQCYVKANRSEDVRNGKDSFMFKPVERISSDYCITTNDKDFTSAFGSLVTLYADEFRYSTTKSTSPRPSSDFLSKRINGAGHQKRRDNNESGFVNLSSDCLLFTTNTFYLEFDCTKL